MMRTLLVALVLPLAACPKGSPGGEHGPKPAAGEVYAGMFEAQRSWTYQVTETGGPDGDKSYQVTCEVSERAEFPPDVLLSYVGCDGSIGEGMQEAVIGMWSADKRGVWYLPDYLPSEEGLTEPIPRADLSDDRMLLPARPVAGTRQILDGGQAVTEVTVEDTAEGWCSNGRYLLGDASWARFCFSEGVVSSGQLGWTGENDHEVEFHAVE